jgi:hypothetical protein
LAGLVPRLQEAVIADQAILWRCLPGLTKDQDWATSDVSARHLTDDDEDTFAPKLELLTQTLLQMMLTQSTCGGSPPAPSHPILGEVTAPAIPGPGHPTTPRTDHSNIDVRHFAFLLAGSGFNPTTNKITVATMSPEAEYLFSTSRLAVLNANVHGYIGELKTVFCNSTDYLDCLIDLPQVDFLACAWFTNIKFEPTVLLNVETPITSGSLFHWTMLAPDSSATSITWATGGNHDFQILMDELPKNLDKVDTSLRAGTNFLTYSLFLTLLANISAIVASFHVIHDTRTLTTWKTHPCGALLPKLPLSYPCTSPGCG